MQSQAPDHYGGFVWVLNALWVDHAFLVRGGVVIYPAPAAGERLRYGTFFTGIRFGDPMKQAVRLGRFDPLILGEYARYAEGPNGGRCRD